MDLKKLSGLCIFVLLLSISAAAKQETTQANLQELVDHAAENSTIVLGRNVYTGPVVINKPLTIDGAGEATVDGQKKGTVIIIKANSVRIKNLKVINTGDRHDMIDAAIALFDSSRCEITNNKIEKSLFGINLQNSHRNLVKDNEISSLPYDLGLRGDGIWVWWSDNNNFTGNKITDSRDIVVWYSMGNNIENNTVTNSRYSLHFMFSDVNFVRNNTFNNNSVGIYNMYSNGIVIEGNTIMRSPGATGMGIGLKEASETVCKNNRIIYCSRGIGVDQSPFEPDTYNYFINNELVFNNEAVSFVTDGTRVNNIFEGNIFKWNIQDVTVSGTRGLAKGSWERNYWDKYEGFDSDRDGVGDTPYKYFIYADQLWVNNPALQFFRGAVVMTFMDFLERLAPFSEPELALVDEKPLRHAARYAWKDEDAIRKRLNERIAASKLLEERRGRKGAVPLPYSGIQH
ncbi:MAG: nitrous oxide reductase family maturation protein NosD [Nitrospirae bacterium]|nr:nitrous oxide reductase family maturation protein NosD [Nitrospirota bacterium]